MVQRVAGRAGVPQFTTHTFRHLRLTDLARCRLDLHEIASYAGHRHLATTHQYIRLSGTELAARVRGATAQLDARLAAYVRASLQRAPERDRPRGGGGTSDAGHDVS